jgi:hypothetical protein
MSDPHGLPVGPEWLEQLRRVKKVAAIGEGMADEIVDYVDALRAAAWPIVRALEDVGDQSNWAIGDETDRVYPWYEIEPLKRAVLGVRDSVSAG